MCNISDINFSRINEIWGARHWDSLPLAMPLRRVRLSSTVNSTLVTYVMLVGFISTRIHSLFPVLLHSLYVYSKHVSQGCANIKVGRPWGKKWKTSKNFEKVLPPILFFIPVLIACSLFLPPCHFSYRAFIQIITALFYYLSPCLSCCLLPCSLFFLFLTAYPRHLYPVH